MSPAEAGLLLLLCQPALPHFCRNIHVSCAGRTEVPTFEFRIRVEGERGWIESAPGYGAARAEKGEGETRVILWPEGRQGYVRVMTDGRYSFRHYVGDDAIMSYGECR